ncbi:uncharacterized protein LOC131251336 [Magnolia sinica]|uniref:uncharacterized protein LOC131251336 n=1 Tax=Magnolia sinica TaxID=86752 RepID=UPI002658E1B8|nr:uncharacterized protein LOC131251336 [Magnolia sinica]
MEEEAKAVLYAGWDEVLVSNEKGRREVHYYLKRSDGVGSSDLAVLGKERSLRHMTYTVQNSFLPRTTVHSLKLRSRREVIDWLSSFVTPGSVPYRSSTSDYRVLDDEDACPEDVPASKGVSSRKVRYHSKEFSWIGSSWTCRKRRRHYQSYCRNGFRISVHDFVYVMVEENKRLVAYLEDLYEDSRANNMAAVRWFHKIDEVGIVLPPDFNDREIFFSLCLQDLSVECIDGIATVLNPQHYEKFLNETTHTLWEPYLCYRQFDNDDVKPFDISQVQGYWNQGLLRHMYTLSSRSNLKSTSSDSLSLEGDGHANSVQSRPKRKNGLKNGKSDRPHKVVARETAMDFENSNGLSAITGGERHLPSVNPATCLPRKVVIKQKPQQLLSVGCHVEVLSQDSGIRGCWFQGVILKRQRDKVKIRYQDVLDADGTGNLEEWVLASRVAAPDELGIRLCGRTTVRPHPPSKGRVSWGFDAGTAVDAWWHDGWWEGIVVRKESEDKIHVYFPGERQTSTFACGDLRRSQEWVCDRWNIIKERPDLASSISPNQGRNFSDSGYPVEALVLDRNNLHVENVAPAGKMAPTSKVSPGSESPLAEKNGMGVEMPANLVKDYSFAQLKWNSSSKKRRRGRESVGKGRQSGSGSSSHEDMEPLECEGFSIPKSMKLDHENCKYGGDHMFVASIPRLTSLVMSR